MAKTQTTNTRSPRNLPNTSAPPVVTPDAETQEGVITAQVLAAFGENAANTAKTADARKNVDIAQAHERTVRGGIMVRLAAASLAGGWTADHITGAVKAALAKWNDGRNAKDTSTDEAGREFARAMHPLAREHVEQAFAEARVAWQAERDAVAKAPKGEKAPTPLQSAFQREYHMVAGSKGMLAAYIASNPDAGDPEALAGVRKHEERVNPQRAASALKRLGDAIAEIGAEFPVEGFDKMLAYVKTLNKDKLVAARKRYLASLERAAKRGPSPESTLTEEQRTLAALSALSAE